MQYESITELVAWLDAERGRRSALARRLNVVPGNIQMIIKRGAVPIQYVRPVAWMTGINLDLLIQDAIEYAERAYGV